MKTPSYGSLPEIPRFSWGRSKSPRLFSENSLLKRSSVPSVALLSNQRADSVTAVVKDWTEHSFFLSGDNQNNTVFCAHSYTIPGNPMTTSIAVNENDR
jgi:hypothetical protein